MRKNRRRSRSHSRDLFFEINVTPFVDILLVLLVAFMLSAPLLTSSLSIELPQGKTKDKASMAQKQRILIVNIDAKRQISINKDSYTFATLTKKLQRAGAMSRKQRVYLQMDKRVPHGFLIDLMLLFKNEGFKNVGLVFEDIKNKSSRQGNR